MWLSERATGLSELADECDAFLAGRYREYMSESGGTVPAWTWINLLAHGDPDTLNAVCHTDSAIGLDLRWRQARAYLAGEVLGSVSDDLSLRELQQTALIPLELELAGQERTRRSPTPADLVSAILGALRNARRVQHRG